jgi:AraC-like DNA-binding protein
MTLLACDPIAPSRPLGAPTLEGFASALQQILLTQLGDSRLTVPELARRLGCDSYTLDLWIQAAEGMGAAEFLMQQRLDRVVELIRERHVDVESAALQAGFRTLAEFLRAFDLRYGVPSASCPPAAEAPVPRQADGATP